MAQNRSNTFAHASHNYDACYKLKEIGGYNDWVVTTAFYSGMKFLQDKMFPGIYDHPRRYNEQEEFESFHRYISAFGTLDGSNKHKEMSKFIEKYVDDDDVINSYEDLKQSCHTARYINYEVGEDRLEMAIDALETIRGFCV